MNNDKVSKLLLKIGDDLPRQMTSDELLSFLIAIGVYYTHSAEMVIALLREGANMVEKDKDLVDAAFMKALAEVAATQH